jgi:hypothetical protein
MIELTDADRAEIRRIAPNRNDVYARALYRAGLAAGIERAQQPFSDPLTLALAFHKIYELLAPDFGYKTQIATREFDPDSPNGRLMQAVCREIIDMRAAAIRALLNASAPAS